MIPGSVVIVGTTNLHTARMRLEAVRDLLMVSGYYAKIETQPKIQNICATFKLNRRLNLHVLQEVLKGWISLELEMFPGLIYREKASNKTCAIIHKSGVIILTGEKQKRDLDKLLKIILRQIQI